MKLIIKMLITSRAGGVEAKKTQTGFAGPCKHARLLIKRSHQIANEVIPINRNFCISFVYTDVKVVDLLFGIFFLFVFTKR